MATLRVLIKPALFTTGVCGICFCGAAICQYENRVKPRNFKDWIPSQAKYSKIRQQVNEWKSNLRTGDKIAAGAIFINFVVFGSWRLKSMRPIMTKFFLSQAPTNATAVKLSPMILSNFSHATVLHFAINMYVLYSFSSFANSLLGPEQLIGLYISAGAVSSLFSIAYRLAAKSPASSLGASGAVLGIIAYICVARPNQELLLFFIPMSAGVALKCLVGLDVVGVIARWKILDHSAHLGGTLTGVLYANYGERLFWQYRKPIVDKWIELKSSVSSN